MFTTVTLKLKRGPIVPNIIETINTIKCTISDYIKLLNKYIVL